MSKTWLVSDTHFGHKGVCEFLRSDDKTKLRPWDNPDEMDEAMIKMWNDVVAPEDRVWHLGDVVINRKALKTINGRKKLIMGNHDIFRASEYLEYFEDVKSFHKLDGYTLTHIPLHPDSVGRWAKGNIHGHLHSNNVMKIDQYNQLVRDERYICVCVEQIGFKPIDFDDIVKGKYK
jgi:calcineurin-like phosphoesterase family protein